MKIFKFNVIRVFFISIAFFFTTMSGTVSADLFFRTGTIVRTLTDTSEFGGCMIFLSTKIANGCPDFGWVSLDCKGTFSSVEHGKRAYASALTAFSLGKRVSVKVDNTKKVNGYCVAQRIDILQ